MLPVKFLPCSSGRELDLKLGNTLAFLGRDLLTDSKRVFCMKETNVCVERLGSWVLIVCCLGGAATLEGSGPVFQLRSF